MKLQEDATLTLSAKIFRYFSIVMKIMTWNINGIRSIKKEKSLKSLFDALDVDIICLQETKVTREMLEEDIAIVEGYNSYFSFSKVRSGYSGVATFCRDNVTPIQAEDKIVLPENSEKFDSNEEGIQLTNEYLEALNAEGRSILTEHLDSDGNHVVILNLYCPRADLDNKERTQFKLKFYSLVQQKCKNLIAENKHVIVVGDFNVSHKLIDHCDPDDPEIFDSNPSRQWAKTFILDKNDEDITTSNENSTKFVDSFRYFHPNQEGAFTCWRTLTGARQTNYGTRIDYIFSSLKFFNKQFIECVNNPNIEGSDHCPVVATLKSSFRNAVKPPPLCTKYMPEFAGKQQKLKAFFKKREVHNMDANGASGNKCTEKNVMGNKRPGSQLLVSQPKRTKTVSKKCSQANIFNYCLKTSGKDKILNHQINVENKQSYIQEELGQMQEESVENPNTLETSQLSKQQTSSNEKSISVVAQWKNLLGGPPPAALCSGHNEPCVLRTVKNKGPNHGKQFYCCARPQGHSTNKEARCKFFKWFKK